MATFRTSFRGGPRSGKAFARIAKGLAQPLVDPVGRQVAAIMRQGAGSVAEQRRREVEMTAQGLIRPWPPGKPFGNRPAPARSLVRSGALDAQWAGGAGSITQIKADSVAIGVQGYGAIHQRERPTVVRAKRRGPTGRLAQQVFLGKAFGAWISERKLLSGLIIPPRRVGLSPPMLRRAAEAVLRGLTGSRREAA